MKEAYFIEKGNQVKTDTGWKTVKKIKNDFGIIYIAYEDGTTYDCHESHELDFISLYR